MRPVGVYLPPDRSGSGTVNGDANDDNDGGINQAGIGALGGLGREVVAGKASAPNSPVPPSTVSVSAVATFPPPAKPERAPERGMTQSRASGRSRTPANAAAVPNGVVGGSGSSATAAKAPSRPQSAYQPVPPPLSSQTISPSQPQPQPQYPNTAAQPFNALPRAAPPLANDFRPNRDPHAAPVDPTSETMIKIGPNAYPVNPSNDPQAKTGLGRRGTSRVPPPSVGMGEAGGMKTSQSASGVGGNEDPLLRQMNELQKEGSLRRHSTIAGPNGPNGVPGGRFGTRALPNQVQPTHRPSTSSSVNTPAGLQNQRNTIQIPRSASPLANAFSSTSPQAQSALSPPNGRQTVDYSAAADALVGSHPSSRPSSPAMIPSNAPIAAHMQPPASASSPRLEVEDMYQQKLPGERRLSISNSTGGMSPVLGQAPGGGGRQSIEVPQPGMQRPSSREGHVGIGAHGRSTSPQPIQPGMQYVQGRPVSRGPSPSPVAPQIVMQQQQQQQMQSRPLSRGPSPQPLSSSGQSGHMAPPATSPGSVYPTPISPPNSHGHQIQNTQNQGQGGGVGIRLDSQGRVIQDSRAETYAGGGGGGGGRPISQISGSSPAGSVGGNAGGPGGYNGQNDPRASMYSQARPVSQAGIPQQQVQAQRMSQAYPAQAQAQIPGMVQRQPSLQQAQRSPSPQPGYGVAPPQQAQVQGLNRQWGASLPQQGGAPPPSQQVQGQYGQQQPARINTDVGGGANVHRQSTLYNAQQPQDLQNNQQQQQQAYRYGSTLQQHVPQPQQVVNRQSQHGQHGFVQAQAAQFSAQQQAQQQQQQNQYGGYPVPRSTFGAPVPGPVLNGNDLRRQSSYGGGYGGPQGQGQVDYRQQQPQVAQMRRSPSPQPPQAGQSAYPDEPKILFYGTFLQFPLFRQLILYSFLQSKLCMTTELQLTRSSIFKPMTSLLSLLHQMMDGGLVSCWTSRGEYRVETSSRAILLLFSRIGHEEFLSQNLSSFAFKLHPYSRSNLYIRKEWTPSDSVQAVALHM